MRYNTGKETKDKFIQAAFKLFGTKGYDATSIDDLLREVGKTKGSFYTHFKHKEDLLIEVMNIRMEIHMDELENMLNEQLRNQTFQVKKFILQTLEMSIKITNTRPYWTGVYLELIKQSNQNNQIRKCINNSYEKWIAVFIKVFQKGKELNQMKQEIDERILATTLIAIYQGYEIHRHVNPDVDLSEQLNMYNWLI